MLELTGIQQFYGQSHILWDVGLTVPDGSCTCLMGRNGVGKTTLLKAVMGLLPVRSGSIRSRAGRSSRSSPSRKTYKWG
jgi:urea transport system ATP-binding protein